MKSTLSTCLRLSGVITTAACAMVELSRLELAMLRLEKWQGVRVVAHFLLKSLFFCCCLRGEACHRRWTSVGFDSIDK
jgi:hypothetical protein